MPLRRFKVSKLVRDKIPDHLASRGILFSGHIMSEPEYLASLREKLIEEAREVAIATSPEELAEELADVLEVVATLANEHGFSLDELSARAQEKAERNGRLQYKTYIEEIEVPAESEHLAYYLARPEAYPEVRKNKEELPKASRRARSEGKTASDVNHSAPLASSHVSSSTPLAASAQRDHSVMDDASATPAHTEQPRKSRRSARRRRRKSPVAAAASHQ